MFISNGKKPELQIGSLTKLCLTSEISRDTKSLFPKDADYTESYLTIEGMDMSDENADITLKMVPLNMEKGECFGEKHCIYINLGSYPKEHIKEMFEKLIAPLEEIRF